MGGERLHRMVQLGCAALGFVALAACSTSVPGTGGGRRPGAAGDVAADDVAEMDRLLPLQRDLIDG